jgi:hypothetical protein
VDVPEELGQVVATALGESGATGRLDQRRRRGDLTRSGRASDADEAIRVSGGCGPVADAPEASEDVETVLEAALASRRAAFERGPWVRRSLLREQRVVETGLALDLLDHLGLAIANECSEPPIVEEVAVDQCARSCAS